MRFKASKEDEMTRRSQPHAFQCFKPTTILLCLSQCLLKLVLRSLIAFQPSNPKDHKILHSINALCSRINIIFILSLKLYMRVSAKYSLTGLLTSTSVFLLAQIKLFLCLFSRGHRTGSWHYHHLDTSWFSVFLYQQGISSCTPDLWNPRTCYLGYAFPYL